MGELKYKNVKDYAPNDTISSLAFVHVSLKGIAQTLPLFVSD